MMRVILRGRRSTWWRCWMTSVAPRIVNDVSYVTRIKCLEFCFFFGFLEFFFGFWVKNLEKTKKNTKRLALCTHWVSQFCFFWFSSQSSKILEKTKKTKKIKKISPMYPLGLAVLFFFVFLVFSRFFWFSSQSSKNLEKTKKTKKIKRSALCNHWVSHFFLFFWFSRVFLVFFPK